MLSLKSALSMSKADLKELVCSTADHKGEASWLWMPKRDCHNPRICLVAHIDTVFDEDHLWGYRRKKRTYIYHDPKAGVWWSPDGLGADDRAGVYAVMTLRQETGCMVLLTDFEETGGIGAHEASEIFRQYFGEIAFFLEIDRKGKGEMVFYNGEPPKFKSFIGGFGFTEKQGTFSDISILSRETGIVGVNVSAGYHRQHTPQEYLREKDLAYTISAVLKIIKEGGKKYDTTAWQITKEVCPQFSGYYNAGDVLLHNRRRRKGAKVACRWEF